MASIWINRAKRVYGYARRYQRLRVNLAHQDEYQQESRSRASAEGMGTDFLLNFPGSPNGLIGLQRWLPLLEKLHTEARVSIMVGDITAYRQISAMTHLPSYFARGTSEPEFIAQQLQTKVMLYINQSKLNLREAGFHDVFHVFLGVPGGLRRHWLNNRLRLYDYVLVPDPDSLVWIQHRLMGMDPERLRLVGEYVDGHGSITDVRSRGVDVDLASVELLAIAEERDRAVLARDDRLAELGITLAKGGQD